MTGHQDKSTPANRWCVWNGDTDSQAGLARCALGMAELIVHAFSPGQQWHPLCYCRDQRSVSEAPLGVTGSRCNCMGSTRHGNPSKHDTPQGTGELRLNSPQATGMEAWAGRSLGWGRERRSYGRKRGERCTSDLWQRWSLRNWLGMSRWSLFRPPYACVPQSRGPMKPKGGPEGSRLCSWLTT